MEEYVVLFFTHSGAVNFKRKLENQGIKCELMPVPRKLSSNCGVSAKIYYELSTDRLLDHNVESVYLVQNGEYMQVYKDVDM